ncbi:hypothetical protein VST04_22750 [Bacillus paranthracis]|uniref:hypothetical protein n=1 Tax=Bacillus paranthracis TaxID=2026186 RepID=UPI002DD42805|nr:hypothetical protein [Bacillus paranthracis]MEC4620916.1 hypothetical protein [Bacillus paranthracis]
MYKYNQLIFPSHMEKNTRFLVLAGFSFNGPVGTPFIIRENTDPSYILGDCRLTENVRMARKYGITPLILRLNGTHGECVVNHDELNTPALRFKTLEATDESNNISIHLFPTHMVVKGVNNSYSYLFADYKGLDELAFAIKQDLYFKAGEVDVEVVNQVPVAGLCLAERHVRFTGADDGFHYVSNHDDSDSDDKLQMQLQLLRDSLIDEDGSELYFTGELSSFQIDTLLFTDIPYEKASAELTSIFGEFAKTKTSEQSIFCSAVLCSDLFSESRYGVTGEDTYEPQIQTLLEKASINKEESRHLEHVEVVVGVQDSENPKYLSMPAAATYACMRYKLPNFHNSATNKQLLYINTLQSRELKKVEVAKLTSSGYICIVPSIKKGFVPFSSKNLYPQNTLYSKPHYLRSISYDVNRIAGFFNQYIGEPFSFVLLQSIITQVDAFIDNLSEDHPIYRNIKMEVLDYDQVNLTLSISFELYGEIESVKTSFTYVPSSEVNVSW